LDRKKLLIVTAIRLDPHPRVTAVAKKTATAAPLALSRYAGEGSSEEASSTAVTRG
jgi:hypothetical protein